MLQSMSMTQNWLKKNFVRHQKLKMETSRQSEVRYFSEASRRKLLHTQIMY